MKLAHKLTAWLVLGNCVVLSGYGLLARAREVDRFERTMEQDTFRAGTTLLSTVEGVWRARGEAEALTLIEHADARQPDMTFRWLPWSELASTALTPNQRQRLREHERAFERSAGELHMYVPFEPPVGSGGVLEVTHRLANDDAYVRSSTHLLLSATLVSVAVSGGIAFLVGAALVGRPMGTLVEQVERVGAGQPSAALELGRADEIGALARALDRMAADLRATDERARAEAAERRATLRQLRHAERLATVGRLAAGIAHELGTPLNVVLARANLLAKPTVNAASAEKHATIIREQTQRMTRIIRQLLDFARRGEAEKSPTEIGGLAATVLETLRPLASRRRVSLELAATREAWTLADPGQLQQVLTNLVMNAIQASPDGGRVEVALHAAVQAPPPEHDHPPGSRWRIDVRDQGPGIPEELRERIFEPFFTTKEVGEGTGLGLTVTHGIVTDHDGWIEVDDEGPGTTFRVFLPALDPPQEASP